MHGINNICDRHGTTRLTGRVRGGWMAARDRVSWHGVVFVLCQLYHVFVVVNGCDSNVMVGFPV